MSGTILLADDSLTIQKVVELTFADTNHRVVAVSSGDELLDRLADSQPDLIICDVIMPGKDGYEVCQQIKSSSEWLHLPVILLTGTFEPFDRDRAIAAGCSEIITKPFEARKLVDTVERLIGGSDLQTGQVVGGTPAAAGEDETWPEEATPIEVPPPIEPEPVGTQATSAEVEEDGIEFTTSGFAEMEAAGLESPTPPVEVDEGLDYEFADSKPAEPAPSADPPAEFDLSAQTVKIDVASMSEDLAPPDVEEPLPPPETEPEQAIDAFETAEPEPVPEPEPEPAIETVQKPFAASDDEEPFEAPAEPVIEDEPSMADTSPVEAPSADTGPVEEVPTDVAFNLTDDDIDRIARRVIELASDRLDQIAWEVVPDMAEIVVRQRIRELEAESEASSPDQVQ